MSQIDLKPLVSVILPVYNGEKYLRESISSILSQTYQNYELIIINDGSTDGSGDIVKTFSDPRIVYCEQANRGLAETLNRGIKLSRGVYIARQDADDMSLPSRLEMQVDFLEKSPDCGLLGTWADIWVEDKPTKRTLRHPIADGDIRFSLIFDNYFVHSSVMIRKSILDRVGFYTASKDRQPEDFELWSRLVRVCSVANIASTLLVYREVRGSICRKEPNPFISGLRTLCAENLAYYTDNAYSEEIYHTVAALAHGQLDAIGHEPDFDRVYDMLLSISRKTRCRGRLMKRRYAALLNFYATGRYGRRLGTLRTIYGLIVATMKR